MKTCNVLDIIIPLAAVTAVITMIIIREREKRIIFNKLKQCFNGYIPVFSIYTTVIGEYEGLKFSVADRPRRKSVPCYLIIKLFKNSIFSLNIYRESGLAELGKKLGIVHEVKTDDADFDADFLLFSNDPAQANNYLNSAEIKIAVRELFAQGFEFIKIGTEKIVIQKPNYPDFDLSPEAITEILKKLNVLAKGL